MLKAKKSLSQNFLIDKNICKKIINQTNLKNRVIIEIGPGYGSLTDFIIEEKPKKLILIEKDNILSERMNKQYYKYKNVVVINNDILKIDLSKHKDCIIISNLPYNQSTKIILYLSKFYKNIYEMIFMIQKEVAIKFDYNIVGMNKYKFINKMIFEYKRCFNVPPSVFIPKPKVESTIIKFQTKNIEINYDKMNDFISKIFKNKRKTLRNKINLKKINDVSILRKRIDQLSIKELLYIYNIF